MAVRWACNIEMMLCDIMSIGYEWRKKEHYGGPRKKIYVYDKNGWNNQGYEGPRAW